MPDQTASRSAGAGEAEDADGQCCVVGTGLTGLAAALAMAQSGFAVSLIGPPPGLDPGRQDRRTSALFGSTIDLLANLGVWDQPALGPQGLAGLTLIDDTGRLFRAPEVTFHARDIGRRYLGYNIVNHRLLTCLWRRVIDDPAIRTYPALATEISCREKRIDIVLANGTGLSSSLLVAADGARSSCRAAAGIATRAWGYPQCAIVASIGHDRPHREISLEFHRPGGPLTTVPTGDGTSGLVWVVSPAEASRLQTVDDRGFIDALSRGLKGLLGRITSASPRSVFPLAGMSAGRLGAKRIVLVGEAGHQLPPIGAQGLNLGLRDVAWLADVMTEARTAGRDPGSDVCLAAYSSARQFDVASRTFAVDTLNRSLFLGLPAADLARATSLAALATLPWLRRAIMHEGVSPAGQTPRLLQPSAASPSCGSNTT